MATTLSPRDRLLPVIDKLRAIPGVFGLRLYTINVVSRSWSGARPGIGASTDTTTGVKVDLGTYQTKLRLMTSQEVVASGGLWEMQDVEIGPITPPYTGSTVDGDAITVFDPTPGTATIELFFKIQGPGYPANGAWFRKVSQNVTKPLRYLFVLRKTGEQL